MTDISVSLVYCKLRVYNIHHVLIICHVQRNKVKSWVWYGQNWVIGFRQRFTFYFRLLVDPCSVTNPFEFLTWNSDVRPCFTVCLFFMAFPKLNTCCVLSSLWQSGPFYCDRFSKVCCMMYTDYSCYFVITILPVSLIISEESAHGKKTKRKEQNC